MDPVDWTLQQHPHSSRSNIRYDPVRFESVQSTSVSLIHHPDHASAADWQPHPFGLHQLYPPHPLQQAPHNPPFFPQTGGLPPPLSGFNGSPPVQTPSGMSGRRVPYAPRHSWRAHGRPGPQMFGDSPGSSSEDNDGSFVNQAPETRSLSFQSAVGPSDSASAQPPSATTAPHSLSRPAFTTGFENTAAFSGRVDSSQFSSPAHLPSSHLSSHLNDLTLPGRRHLSSSLTPPGPEAYDSLASTVNLASTRGSPPQSTSASSGPRRTPRARRAMSGPSRAYVPTTDPVVYEEIQELLALHDDNGPTGHSVAGLEAEITRQLQLLQGSMTSQRGASKATINSLVQLRIDELPEDERSCSICYNEFGVESPEGCTEIPLRLPKCQHVFGDVCIKKWLEDSHHCPYCRDELTPAQGQPAAVAARTFLNSVRAQLLVMHRQPRSGRRRLNEGVPRSRLGNSGLDFGGRPAAASLDNESRTQENRPSRASEAVFWDALLAPASIDGARRALTERHSPPSDSDGQLRRTRPRHSHSGSYVTAIPVGPLSRTSGTSLQSANSIPTTVPELPDSRVIMPPMPVLSQGPEWAQYPAARPVYAHMTTTTTTPAQLAPVNTPQEWRPPFSIRDLGAAEHASGRAPILPNPLAASHAAWERHNRENIPPIRAVVHLPQESSTRGHEGPASPAGTQTGLGNAHFSDGE